MPKSKHHDSWVKDPIIPPAPTEEEVPTKVTHVPAPTPAPPGPEPIKFALDTRVRVVEGREQLPTHVNVEGTVRAVDGNNFGVIFDGTNNNLIHRWYSADDLVSA